MVLRGDRRRAFVVTGVAATSWLAALLIFGVWAGQWTAVIIAIAPTAIVTLVSLTYLSNRIEIGGDALVTYTRRRRQSYRWDDLLELGWEHRPYGRMALMARARGGPWDTPGPNIATIIGQLTAPSQQTKQALIDAAAEHHVPYTPNLSALLTGGRRMPRLASDDEPRSS